MAKVKTARKSVVETILHLGNITDSRLSFVFDIVDAENGLLDEKTVRVIRERVRNYVYGDLVALYSVLKMLQD